MILLIIGFGILMTWLVKKADYAKRLKLEQKKIRQELEESEQRYSQMFHYSAAMMLIADPVSGRIIESNPSSQQFYQYGKEEFESITLDDLLVQSDGKPYPANKRFENRPHYIITDTLLKDGKTKKAEIYSCPIRIKKTDMLYLIIHDITKRYEYQEQLKEANNTKDKFFSILAHDLINPFNAILGLISILSEDFDLISNNRKKRVIDTVQVSADRFFRLLQNLLDWSRSQTGKLEVIPSAFSISSAFQEISDDLYSLAKSKGVYIQVEVKEDFIVYADKNMINSVLNNLITNAIKFSNRRNTVTLSATKDGDFCEVSVHDDGIGIPKENLTSLFRIDSDVRTNGTENEKGTGLGLILCREFVEKNHGRIRVESNYGYGSTFYFTLPLAKEHLSE